jgi:Mg-chelatase subunit ChlD
MTDDLTFDRYQRWRLVLGKTVEEQMAQLRASGAGGSGGGGGGGGVLSKAMSDMDEALGAIYDHEQPEEKGKRGAGLGSSAPRLAAWLADVRKYFERDVVVVIQQDAIEKKGLKQLLFEPETLAQITPSVELVGTLLALKGMIPDKTKETARMVVSAVVEEIKKRLSAAIEKAVRGALNRSRHQPLPSLPNMDWKRTIQANLKNYVPERHTIIPDHFFFYARQQRRKEWNVIVCMDQSGSMAESVIYASVMGAIFASIPALETHVIAFDTEVVDLTQQCDDPVDLLFGVQLGGGTDINRAVGYCQGLIHDLRKTLLILITDLYEGGNETSLVKRVASMMSDGVRGVCMLALSDSGVPSYDDSLARKLANVGMPCLGCTPNVLPDVLAGLLKGKNVDELASKFDTRKKEKLPERAGAQGLRPRAWRAVDPERGAPPGARCRAGGGAGGGGTPRATPALDALHRSRAWSMRTRSGPRPGERAEGQEIP